MEMNQACICSLEIFIFKAFSSPCFVIHPLYIEAILLWREFCPITVSSKRPICKRKLEKNNKRKTTNFVKWKKKIYNPKLKLYNIQRRYKPPSFISSCFTFSKFYFSLFFLHFFKAHNIFHLISNMLITIFNINSEYWTLKTAKLKKNFMETFS